VDRGFASRGQTLSTAISNGKVRRFSS
jgi:hypothetical protein